MTAVIPGKKIARYSTRSKSQSAPCGGKIGRTEGDPRASAGFPLARMSEFGCPRDQVEIEAVGERGVPVAREAGVAHDAEEQDQDGRRERPRGNRPTLPAKPDREIKRADGRTYRHARETGRTFRGPHGGKVVDRK